MIFLVDVKIQNIGILFVWAKAHFHCLIIRQGINALPNEYCTKTALAEIAEF